ncbi:cytochrome P450 [Nocardia sp. BMG51109]|uniref:cytochrome P450 n=1 Tax=Nocardia sp. BMG51109 TaxID=1056816 RepID=UPI001E2AC439|nr:cytochrome P450 [Nocardia sp. BMG51109]
MPGPFVPNRPAYPGFFMEMDPPEHTRFRRLLTAQFTVRRINQLEARIEEIVESHLDEMARARPPVDLVSMFAMPIPMLVICELLGVPYTDREFFLDRTETALSLGSDHTKSEAALGEIVQYIADLAVRKRAEPTDDLLSGLAADAELTELELGNIGMLLLLAGHQTTSDMLALGTLTLLSYPEQLVKLRADPSLIEGAVEELLRFLSVVHIGPSRTALEDVEVDGVLIRQGETVTLSLPSINRDPAQFADEPDALDVTRAPRGHLAFGHGVHQCLGKQLSRIELRIGFGALLRRFPGIALAVPPDQVRMRDQVAIYGVERLPVTWPDGSAD